MANDASTNESIAKRIREQKEQLLKFLRERPMVLIACKRVGINRSTFYHWCSSDLLFAQDVEEAKQEGRELGSEIAETQLDALIKDKHFQAIKYKLEHNTLLYSQRPAQIAQKEEERERNEKEHALIMAENDPESQREIQKLMQEMDARMREIIARPNHPHMNRDKEIPQIKDTKATSRIELFINGSDPQKFPRYKVRLARPNEYFVPAVLPEKLIQAQPDHAYEGTPLDY